MAKCKYRERGSEPCPNEGIWWLAYGAGACISIADEKVRENIVRCFETAHKLMKELAS